MLRSPVAAALHSLAAAARRSTAAAAAVGAGRSCCGTAVLGIQTWRRTRVCDRTRGPLESRARRPGVKSEVGRVALGQQGASYR